MNGPVTVAREERPDEELLVAGRTDPEAFAEFYRRHLETVLGYHYRRTGCAETAAELTAETFAQALRSIGRYRPTGAPASAWLLGIAHNQLRHYLRRRRIATAARTDLGIATDTVLGDDERQQIENRFDAELQGPELQRAWGSLSASLAGAVRLRVIEERPYREVAELLGCSEGAARVRVARGLSKLAAGMAGR